MERALQVVFSDAVPLEALDEEMGYQVEGQYLFQSERFNLTTGFGVYNAEIDRGIEFNESSSSNSFDRDQHTVYLYSYLNWPKNMLWTGGLSYDFQQEEDVDLIDGVNPRLGLQWDLTDYVRLRMAYVETPQRTLIVEQSIEPTQVAGFNQYFDDLTGTQAKRYGVALDARWSEKLYGGIEASKRDLEVPILSFSGGVRGMEEWREQLYRGYLYWTPSLNWAASAEYLFDRFKGEGFFSGPSKVDTMSVPITLRYFDASGFFAGLGATYVQQEVEDLFPREGSDNFVIVDAAMGYRLPRRLGIISLGIRNLLDEEFSFQDDSFRSNTSVETKTIPGEVSGSFRFVPDREIFGGVTLSF